MRSGPPPRSVTRSPSALRAERRHSHDHLAKRYGAAMSADLQFTVEPTTQAASDDQRATILANPGFGQYFSDHMAIATWSKESGWHDARITAFGPLELSPATAVFHYAQTIFEGMKAYRHPDDSIHMFRPEANAARFARSAHRLALPELPEAAFLDVAAHAGRAGQGLGARRWRDVALPAAVHVRVRPVPRRPPVRAGHVLRDRVAGRLVLLRRRQAGPDLAERGVHPGRPWWHRRGEDRR